MGSQDPGAAIRQKRAAKDSNLPSPNIRAGILSRRQGKGKVKARGSTKAAWTAFFCCAPSLRCITIGLLCNDINPLVPMKQPGLFRLQIEYNYPFVGTTAALKRVVKAEDGLTYAVKEKTGPDDYTPVNELVCCEVGRIVGVPMPDHAILRDFDGRSLVFGSRWEGGMVDSLTFCRQVEDPSVYSLILAFDVLMLNHDRHVNNYLIQLVREQYKVLAVDHSHALLKNWPLPDPSQAILFPNENSRYVLVMLKTLNKLSDKKRIEAVLEKFKNIEAKVFENIVSHCEPWLDESVANQLSGWLQLRRTCIDQIVDYLERWNYDPVSILSNIAGP